MRQVLALLVSVLLHGGLVLSALIYFPAASRLAAETLIVPIELVTLSDTTNIRARIEEDVEPEPEEVEPEPLAAPEPEAEPVPPEPEPEIIPPAPADDPEPEPEPEPEPQPEPEPPVQEPEPDPEPEPRGLDLGALSRQLDLAREERNTNQGEAGDALNAAGAGTAMTATLQTMAASQIQRCVRSNVDAPRNRDLRVVVEVRLERDGSLSGQPRLRDQNRVLNSSDPFLRVAGDRALRAVIDCAPYSLPAQHYQEWRLLEVMVDTQRGR